jgi:CRISPR-associated protein Csn2
MMLMKVSFSGFEKQVEIGAGTPTVLEIHNTVLFTRVCQALLSELAEDAIEPYTLWDSKEKRINPKAAFISCSDLFNLPWDGRTITSKLFVIIESLLNQDEQLRVGVEDLNRQINTKVEELSFQLDANYSFQVEWAIGNYLKAFGFSPVRNLDASLLENLIQFIDFISDIGLKKPLLFVNLKNFLTKNQVEEVFERVFFHEIGCLLIEHEPSDNIFVHEEKIVVEQDFTEHLVTSQSDYSSFSQEGICSNCFGTVAF